MKHELAALNARFQNRRAEFGAPNTLSNGATARKASGLFASGNARRFGAQEAATAAATTVTGAGACAQEAATAAATTVTGAGARAQEAATAAATTVTGAGARAQEAPIDANYDIPIFEPPSVDRFTEHERLGRDPELLAMCAGPRPSNGVDWDVYPHGIVFGGTWGCTVCAQRICGTAVVEGFIGEQDQWCSGLQVFAEAREAFARMEPDEQEQTGCPQATDLMCAAVIRVHSAAIYTNCVWCYCSHCWTRVTKSRAANSCKFSF